MYLKAIELAGFKSFAMRTRLDLNAGLTAIVGPNGSGKSNLTDAVRWVLGEQSSRSLRGQQMSDLIFSGSSEHRAVGMAEVQLVFDNSDFALPSTHVEVAVTRRVFRDGGSEYLLNGRSCRLREIVDLFTDTGLGKSSFAIIGQGQIDAILDERPEERRGIFEEAAGIAGHRQRKSEAQRRLHKVSEQLVRIDDLVQVLQENEQHLSEQATLAKQYLALRVKLQQAEHTLSYHDIIDRAERWQTSQNQKLKNEEDIRALTTKIAVTEAELVLLQEQLVATEQKQQETNQALWQSRQEQERWLGEQKLWNERKQQLQERQLGRQTERAQVQSMLQQAQGAVHSAEQVLHTNLIERKQQASEREKLQLELQGAETDVQLAATERQRQRDLRIAQQGQTVRTEAYIEQVRGQIAELESRSEQLETQQRKTRQMAEEAETQAAHAEQRIASSEARVAEEAARMEQLRTQQHAIEAKRSTARNMAEHIRQELSSAELQSRFLRNMEEQREGYQRGVQQLLAARDKGRHDLAGLIDVFTRVINVGEEWELAIETALGGAAQNLVCEREVDAENAIAWLKAERAGRVTFLPLDVSVHGRLAAKPRADTPGYVGLASELVECDSKYRPMVDRQLGRTHVMRDLPSALAFARASGYRERIVTMEGEQLYSGGSLSGGSAGRRDQSLLARPRLLAEIQEHIHALSASAEEQRTELEQYEAEMKHIMEAFREQSEAEMVLAKEEVQLKERVSLWRSQSQELLNRVVEASAEYDRVQRQREELHAKQADLLRTQPLQQEENIRAEQEEAEIVQREEELRSKQQRLMAAIGVLDSNIGHMSALQSQSEQQLEEHHEHISAWTKRLEQLELEDRQQEDQQEHYLTQGLEAEQNVQQEITRQQQLQHDIASLVQERVERGDAVAEVDAQLNTLRRQQDRLDRRQQDMLLSLARLQDEENYLSRRLWEEHQLTPEALLSQMDALLWSRVEQNLSLLPEQEEYPLLAESAACSVEDASITEEVKGDIPVDDATLHAHRLAVCRVVKGERQNLLDAMQACRQQLVELGHVNLGSIDELVAVQQRISEYHEQCSDLRLSSTELDKLIDSLEKLMSRQFQRTVLEVEKAFQELFRTLFVGGEAELHFTVPEAPLEGGISINVRLPGKRTSSLVLLSGGERALTALALLLAIAKVKAPPFFLLDEVETALDEANLERLAALLQEISKDCQVLTITHRRPTMEAAAALIGVTMQTRGVSTVLAVQLNKVV